ncbi:MAG: hypothetical protein IPQ08_13555 [Chitinophagaceae bacterium]|nr:hypothetical protein [Chitinophagaceae bacterium]
MKKLILCILLVMGQQLLMAQKLYFVYLQSDNKQPFYLRMGTRTIQSGNGGYLILSKLRDSIYHFNVGSPDNKFPEQSFTVTVNKKDHGYLLKDFGENGWGLFDLQTLEVLKSETSDPKKDKAMEVKNVSLFTEVLAKAADDPSLKEKTARVEVKTTVIKPEEKKPEEKVVVKTEPKEIIPAVKDTQALAIQTIPEKKKDIPDIVERVNPPAYHRSDVKRHSESSTTEGMGIVYTDDMGDGSRDTIRILIPVPKQAFSTTKEVPREEKKFLEIDTVKKIEEETVKEEKQPVKDSISTVGKTETVNDCREKASQDDFFKVRKNMAAVSSDDEMIAVARLVFQTKCFSTLQIKNLSSLFLNEEGKFQFFVATQTHVSDKENFSTLRSEFREEKYLQLFTALVAH